MKILSTMMNDIKTPCFILDYCVLEEEINNLKESISKYWSNTTVAYSVKTNSLPYLAKQMNKLGISAEVSSEDEFDLVNLCGYSSKNIICNGPVKSYNFIKNIIDNNIKVNIDSHSELQYIISYAKKNINKRIEIGIRVNTEIETKFPNDSKNESRFGFGIKNGELYKVIKQIRNYSNIVITGLHLHTNTTTRTIEIYEYLTELFIKLVKKYSLSDIEYLDIGGGFWGGIQDKPNWNDYFKVISSTLIKYNFNEQNIKLIIEPGVSLLASPFKYVTTVLDIKKYNNTYYIVTDGSRIHIDPLFHKTNYFYEIISSKNKHKVKKQTIVGFTCLENDRIITLNNTNKLSIGDKIIFNKIGAYTMTLSPLFINYFPIVYSMESDNSIKCIRDKWTAQEFIQKSKL